LTEFQEIWCEQYEIEGHFNSVPWQFLHLVITGRRRECPRWERHLLLGTEIVCSKPTNEWGYLVRKFFFRYAKN